MKTDIKIRKVDNNGSDAWVYRGTNIQIKKSCKKYTEEEFKEYVLSKLNEKDENMTQQITKPDSKRFLDRMAAEWSTKDDSKPGDEVLSSRPLITSPETKPLKSVSKPKEKTVFEIYAEILGEEPVQKNMVHGFVIEGKYPYYGEDRYFKETERLFPGNSWLLTLSSGYYGYLGMECEWFREDEYIMFEKEEVGLVRQDNETLEDFEKRYKQYVKKMKEDRKKNDSGDE